MLSLVQFTSLAMFEIEKLKSELARKVETPFFKDMVRFVDSKNKDDFCILSSLMEDCLKRIASMKVYEDDIWIVTNPKCGTTWTQEMVSKINSIKVSLLSGYFEKKFFCLGLAAF